MFGSDRPFFQFSIYREEHSMDQYRSRPKLSENFEGHWSIPFPGEIHMDQSLVHTFSWGNSYGPMVLKLLQKFPPTLVIFFFPCNPHPPPPRQTPPAVPPERARFRLRFGSVWLRFGSVSAPFGSVSAPFRLRFGSVSGPFRGCWVGSGRGRGEGLL